jgi:antirestriction protein ArdC
MPGGPPIHVESGSDQAYYSLNRDSITVPTIEQFKTQQQYYSVLFHEMVHSTGAESRLKRELTGHKPGASKGYAFEELIAEMGAAFLCGHGGIGTANFDNRSFRLNFEITLLFSEASALAQVEAMFAADFARSTRASAGDFSSRSWWFRLAARTARLMAPIQ